MKNVDKALALFKDFNCAQAVCAACGPALGLDETTCLRMAGGFGGGMGRLAGTCGAISGAVIVLGLKYAPVAPDDREAKARTYEKVRELVQQFTQRHGTIICKELLGCDMSTEKGFALARQRDLHNTLCPTFVRSAVEIIDTLLKA